MLSFALPGNSFPVVENSKGPKSRTGYVEMQTRILTRPRTAIVGGYNSHYVVTLPTGEPPASVDDQVKLYDEIVIPQEYVIFWGRFRFVTNFFDTRINFVCRAQVAPAVVIKVDTRNLAQLERRLSCADRRLMNPGMDLTPDSEVISLSETLLG